MNNTSRILVNMAADPIRDTPGHWLDPIYAPWEGVGSEMARDIEEEPVTVNQWRFRGRIPERYWEKIISKAALKGHTLRHRDFINPDFRVESLDA